MCCGSSRPQKQSSPKLLLLSLQEGTNYFKYSGPTDTNCGQTQSLPCGCKSVRSPSDGERVGFYILVESSSQHRALSRWLFPTPPHLSRVMRLSRAMLCTSATLQPARDGAEEISGSNSSIAVKRENRARYFLSSPTPPLPGHPFRSFFSVEGGRRQTLGVGCPFPWTCRL